MESPTPVLPNFIDEVTGPKNFPRQSSQESVCLQNEKVMGLPSVMWSRSEGSPLERWNHTCIVFCTSHFPCPTLGLTGTNSNSTEFSVGGQVARLLLLGGPKLGRGWSEETNIPVILKICATRGLLSSEPSLPLPCSPTHSPPPSLQGVFH